MPYILADFQPQPGHHCISNSLKQIFHFYGHPFSEEMIFGLASGLHFFYMENKMAPYPMISGRTRIGDFENSLAKHLGITISLHKTRTSLAYSELLNQIKAGNPVMIYVDMAYLKYLNLPDDAHFGGHSVVVFGIDEEQGIAYVSDRDGKDFKITLNPQETPADFHLMPLADLVKARSSKAKPFPAENKWLTFDFNRINRLHRSNICRAIWENTQMMLKPPVKNLGLKGIRLFSEKVTGWSAFDDEKLKWSAFNAFILINRTGGTGGGAFRTIYGNFLKESASISEIPQFTELGGEYLDVSQMWDRIADSFYEDVFQKMNRNALPSISLTLKNIYQKETVLMKSLEQITDKASG